MSERADMATMGLGGPAGIALPRLAGRGLRLARAGWILLALAATAVLLAALPWYGLKMTGQLSHAAPAELAPGDQFFAALSAAASLASALLSLGLALIFFRRRFSEPAAAALAFYLLSYGIVMGGPLEGAAKFWLGNAELALAAQGMLLALPTLALLLLFPNGRFVPDWTRWVLLLAVPWNLSLVLLPSFNPTSLASLSLPGLALLALWYLSFIVVGLYAQVYRYRYVSSAVERQQAKWVIFGFGIWILYVMLSTAPYLYLVSLPPDAPVPWWGPASEAGWFLSLNIMPVCLTIAVTRHRLLNIDLVINRTLVYGALTVAVAGIYALIVGGVGALVQARGHWSIALLATGLVAVLFQPLRERLQRRVNRLVYGQRDEPFEVLARLGQRLEDSLAPELVYPTIVETVAQTLKLPYAAIVVWREEAYVTAESYGKPGGTLVSFPMSHQGELVGQLQVSPRAANEPFTVDDERLLRSIARQAGTAVYAAQLTAGLQRARQALVTTREEERRRLRRDLHDGLGPHLASQTLTIDAIGKLLARDPERAAALLQDLKAQSQTAVQDIRRLVHNLRPPALDELGLVGALREEVARQSVGDLRVSVAAPERLPPLPAAVEVAAYRIVQEAVTNVVRHAGATRCMVRLALVRVGATAVLRVELVDDGRGLPDTFQPGVGLQSMRERAAELGGQLSLEHARAGGVRVVATLPILEPELPAPPGS